MLWTSLEAGYDRVVGVVAASPKAAPRSQRHSRSNAGGRKVLARLISVSLINRSQAPTVWDSS